jgi:hypothetical protein
VPSSALSPGCWGYYLAPLVTAFHIQPLWGWASRTGRSPGFTWGYSYSTPLGLGPSSALSPGFTWGYSYSTPLGLGLSHGPFPRFHLGLFKFNPFGVAVGSNVSPGFTWGYSYSTPLGLPLAQMFPQVAPGAIQIQPLWGWGLHRPFPRFHLGLFIFNPYGVGASCTALSPGCWGYSYSTPLGLPLAQMFPQVAPGAIHIQPLRGWGLLHGPFPRLHLGLIKFNPYRGWGLHRPFPRLHLGLLSRSARYCVSTPIWGWALIGTQNKTRVKNAQAFGNRFHTLVLSPNKS